MRKLALLFISLVWFTTAVHAQDSEPAYLRVVQLSFVSEVGSTVDIDIDGTTEFEGISFPFSTDYIELEPGEHTLTTTLPAADDASASSTLSLEEGHRYTVITQGDYSQDAVQHVLVDETDLPLDETGSVAIIANLTPVNIDLLINEEAALEGITASGYEVIALAEDAESYTIVPADELGVDDASDYLNRLSNVTLLTVAQRSDNGELQVIQHHSSTLSIAEHLLSLETAAPFVDTITAVTTLATESSEDGTYTIFVPTTDAFVDSVDLLPTDPAELEVWLANHVTLANLAPYQLHGTENLTMLSGNNATLNFGDTESGYWEIEGAPIWWDIRLADGVIYIIDGIILDIGEE